MKPALFKATVIGAFITANALFAATLDDVQSRGELNCGISTGLNGFASKNGSDVWSGFDVDFCRAVAAAVLSDPFAVNFVPTTAETRFDDLASGDIDIIARNTTWTFTRDVGMEFQFAGINYYDGQGFMVRRKLGATSVTELDGAKICVNAATTTEQNLTDFFRSSEDDFEFIQTNTSAEAEQLYLAGECDVYTADASALAASLATFASSDQHIILPEIISNEPFGLVVRGGDQGWEDVVRWVLNALIAAEELGVTSVNVEELSQAKNENAEINRLLGTEGNFGEQLGLSPDWAKNAIAAVGNYGEIFENNIGKNSPIGLLRGFNALWSDFGLLSALPFR